MSQLSDIKSIKNNSSPEITNEKQGRDHTIQPGDVVNADPASARSQILQDYNELTKHYPYASIKFQKLGSVEYGLIRVIAVKKKIIDKTLARKEDFLDEYSRELFVVVPHGYRSRGCIVQGAKWLDLTKIPKSDIHLLPWGITLFDRYVKLGYNLCIGVQESFADLKNVILENVRTADHILTAYENFMRGDTNRIKLFGLKHGKEGSKEYSKFKKGGRYNARHQRSHRQKH